MDDGGSAIFRGLNPKILERYEHDEAVVCILDSGWNIAWCNAAWDRFADENGAPELKREAQTGRSVLEATCEDLRPFYEGLFERVGKENRDLGHLYQCSSPTVLRLLHMRVLPLGNNSLMLVHSQIGEMQHGPASAGNYRHANGMIYMCAHCRRTRRPESKAWDWVPTLVERLPKNVIHGLCEFCRSYHYRASGA